LCSPADPLQFSLLRACLVCIPFSRDFVLGPPFPKPLPRPFSLQMVVIGSPWPGSKLRSGVGYIFGKLTSFPLFLGHVLPSDPLGIFTLVLPYVVPAHRSQAGAMFPHSQPTSTGSASSYPYKRCISEVTDRLKAQLFDVSYLLQADSLSLPPRATGTAPPARRLSWQPAPAWTSPAWRPKTRSASPAGRPRGGSRPPRGNRPGAWGTVTVAVTVVKRALSPCWRSCFRAARGSRRWAPRSRRTWQMMG
jgi:hypothetical protein